MYDPKPKRKIITYVVLFVAVIVVLAISGMFYLGLKYQQDCTVYKNIKSLQESGFKINCEVPSVIPLTREFLLTDIVIGEEFVKINYIDIEGTARNIELPTILSDHPSIIAIQKGKATKLGIVFERGDLLSSLSLGIRRFLSLNYVDPVASIVSWNITNQELTLSENRKDLVKNLVNWIRKLNTEEDIHPLALLFYTDATNRNVFVDIDNEVVVPKYLVGRYFFKILATLSNTLEIYDKEEKVDLARFVSAELESKKEFDIKEYGGANCDDVYSFVSNIKSCGQDCINVFSKTWEEESIKWCDETLYKSYESNWLGDSKKLTDLSTILDREIVVSTTRQQSGFVGGENYVRLNSDLLLGMSKWLSAEEGSLSTEDKALLKKGYQNLVYTFGISTKQSQEIYYIGLIADELYRQTGDSYYKRDVERILGYLVENDMLKDLALLENINYIAAIRFLDMNNMIEFDESLQSLLERSLDRKYSVLYSYVPEGFELEYFVLDQVELINLLLR